MCRAQAARQTPDVLSRAARPGVDVSRAGRRAGTETCRPRDAGPAPDVSYTGRSRRVGGASPAAAVRRLH
ncbi:hypothetical protein J116_004205 [Streptomyces thermolilacinus SPC6]|uniref:Uncharacterized protein n=1 Tax=Streptomyces thermolilacinus SPC6 TaxID=1306406 RepID=A0A1D3DN78_9ACTN|nr:hypothetical protein J116_004205 [Streptomyces thermolilacinus SPC6]